MIAGVLLGVCSFLHLLVRLFSEDCRSFALQKHLWCSCVASSVCWCCMRAPDQREAINLLLHGTYSYSFEVLFCTGQQLHTAGLLTASSASIVMYHLSCFCCPDTCSHLCSGGGSSGTRRASCQTAAPQAPSSQRRRPPASGRSVQKPTLAASPARAATPLRVPVLASHTPLPRRCVSCDSCCSVTLC